MSAFNTLRTALASLGANKLRSSLTLLGVVIGVAAVISLMSIGRGAQQVITSNIQALGTNLLFVRPGAEFQGGISQGPGSASTLTLEDAYALLDEDFAPSVQAVAPELRTGGQLVAGRTNTFSSIVGATPEYLQVRNLSMSMGQFISEFHVDNRTEVVVLGSAVSERLFGLRNPVGQHVRINGRQFTIIGVLESAGGGPQGIFDDQALVPITTAYYRLASRRTTQGGISIQTINVQAKSEDVMDSAAREVANILRFRHRIAGEDDFTITSQEDLIETLEQATNTFILFLGAIASISLLVGGIGIMNIMLVSVTERTREIGIRKAMGAKRRDILFQFLTEATLLSLTGGGMGVAIGFGLSTLVTSSGIGGQEFRAAFTGDIAILALVVSASIGLFFGIYPAIRASVLHPIDALRYE